MTAIVRQIAVDDLVPTPDNPRILCETSPEFLDLVASVRASGVLVHVLARPHPTETGKYDLRYGARRHRAAQLAELATIPCIVRDLTDAEAFDLTFAENWGREDLTPTEEGRAVGILLEKHKGDVPAVAARLGQSQRWVATRARIAALSDDWFKALQDPTTRVYGFTTAALALVARHTPEMQARILQTIIDTYAHFDTTADLEEWLKKNILRLLSSAPWQLADVDITPDAGACTECPTRSSRQGQLFHDPGDDLKKSDTCLDPDCWQAKTEAALVMKWKTHLLKYDKLTAVANGRMTKREEQFANTAFGGAKESWNVRFVKKCDPAARPAMVVAGPGLGTVKWIASCSGPSGGAPPPTGPTPLATRREQLDRRRTAMVLQTTVKALDTFLPPPLDFPFLELMTAFGTIAKHLDCGLNVWDAFADATDPTKAEWLRKQAWTQIKGVLIERLSYYGSVGNITPNHLAEAERSCKLIGAPFAEYVTAAEAKHREPKSWATLNADGTPKATKPAAKGAAPKKKTTKKPGKKAKAGAAD